MRNFRVIATFAVAMLVLAACSSGGGASGHESGNRGAEADPAPAPVVPAGAVRRLLRGPRQGLLPGRGLRRHDPARRGRDRAGDGRRRRPGRVRHQLGAADARPARVRRGRRRHRPDLPALADAAGLVQGQEHHQARGPEGQEGRRRGASATRPSCTPGCARPASTRPTRATSTSSPSSSTWSPSAPARSTPPRR